MIMLPVPQPQTSPNRPSRAILPSSTCKPRRNSIGRQSGPRLEGTAIAQPLIQLDFSDLAAFDLVCDQYRQLGLQFEGAIAIQPSNPIFANHSGSVVLIPTASNSAMTLYCSQAACSVGVHLIAARQVNLTAFDTNHRTLSEHSVGSHQYLQQQTNPVDSLPLHYLEIKNEGITKIVIDSDAPFIVDKLSVRF